MLSLAESPAAGSAPQKPEAATVGIRLEISDLDLSPALQAEPSADASGAAAAPKLMEPGAAHGAPPAAPLGPGKPRAAGETKPVPSAASGAVGAAIGAREPDLGQGQRQCQGQGPGVWRCHVEVEGPGGEVPASLPLVLGAALSLAEAGKAKPAVGKAAKVPQAAKGKDGRTLVERAQVRHYRAGLLFTCLTFGLSMPCM